MAAHAKKSASGMGALTGAQKSAVLCLALGPEVASRILQKLAPEEVERVSREIAALSSVQGEVVNAVMAEFQQVAQDKGGGVHGGVAFAQQLLVETVGAQEAKGVLGRIREPGNADLRTLEHAAPDVLGGLLLNEHPQTVALVLSHIGAAQAASMLRAMDADRAAEILTRMGRLESVAPEMLGLVQAGLPAAGDLPRIEKGAATGGADLVADVMNQLSDREQELMEAIQSRDPDLGTRIKARMFTFEDLIALDARAVQNLLRQVETKDLALALKGASEELRQHLKSGLSERAREALDEEIEMLGPVRVRDVEAVHGRILETVRSLQESGEIVLAGRGNSDEIIP